MKKKHILLFSVYLFTCFFTLFAQTSKPSPRAISPLVVDNTNPKLSVPVSLSAQNAGIDEVLKMLTRSSGMTFVAAQDIKGKRITLDLRNTPLEQAINLVVRAAGLSYEVVGDAVLVGEIQDLAKDVGKSGYVIQLKYVDVDEAAAMLAEFGGQIRVDRGGNRLICYATPRVIAEIERIVMAIDKPHILVLLETRLVEVSMNDLLEYGINWSSLSPVSAAVTHPAVELSKNTRLSEWNLLGVQFQTTLNFMLQNGDARILMDSKLATTNKKEAHMHVGEVVPYVIQSYNPEQGGGVSLKAQEKEVGVILRMTPYVNEDFQVTLSVNPEVSNIVGWKGTNSDLPMVAVRKTSTTVRVESGQTIFIAGLLSEEKIVENKKVPLLGSIPLLGIPFRYKKNTSIKKNLIIQITPKIIWDSRELSTMPDFRLPGTEPAQIQKPKPAPLFPPQQKR